MCVDSGYRVGMWELCILHSVFARHQRLLKKKKKKVKLMAEEQSDKCLLGVRHLAKFRVALDEARSEQHR